VFFVGSQQATVSSAKEGQLARRRRKQTKPLASPFFIGELTVEASLISIV
jgi:hypothetical protein